MIWHLRTIRAQVLTVIAPSTPLTARPRDGAARTEGTSSQRLARPYPKQWHL